MLDPAIMNSFTVSVTSKPGESPYLAASQRSITVVVDELDLMVTDFNQNEIYENGSSAQVTLKWDLNKEPTYQSLNLGIGEINPSLSEYTFTTPFTQDTVITLTVKDNDTTVVKSMNIKFVDKIYYGTSPKETLTASEIKSNFSSRLKPVKGESFKFDCSDGSYFYLAFPKDQCSDISFQVNNFSYSDFTISEMKIKNSAGTEIPYNVYRSNNMMYGSEIPVSIK